MFKPTNLIIAVLLGVCTASSILAQSMTKEPVDTAPIVTASATGERVRFAAPGAVGQLRLEILSAGGLVLFEVQGKGNVLDWALQDGNGARLPDGSYLCVVTITSLSGRISRRIGSLELSGPQVNLQAIDRLQMTDIQQQTVGPVEPEAGISVLQASEVKAATTLAHDGNQAELTRSNGALSFRLGDFFSGTDTEQMVLTEEGNLGLGTDKPQSKLDVSGDIRATGMVQASKGIAFADGTVQTTGSSGRRDAGGNVIPNVAGTGTQDKLAKWTDNSGTLGDSGVTESSGNLGIGTASPANKLDIVRGTAGQMAKGFFEMSSFEYNADAKFGVYSSASSAPSAAVTFGSTVLQANNKFPGFELQYIYSPTPAQNQARFNYIERSANGAVANFAANLLTINGNGDVTLNPVTVGTTASPRLAIGTSSPAQALHVVADQSASSTVGAVIENKNILIGRENTVLLDLKNIEPLYHKTYRLQNVGSVAGRTGNFEIYDVGGGASRFTIDPSGNVGIGIGTTAPAQRLEVVGNVKVSGNGNGFFFADGTSMTTAGATLGANSFTGNQSVTGNVSATGTLSATGAVSGGSASFTGDVNTTTQYNIGGNRVFVAGSNNTFAGIGAGQNNASTGNSFFGQNAGFNNTGANNNSFFGQNAGQNNTGGAANSFFGQGAGISNQTGSFNAFFGASAGRANTAQKNAFFGQNAGFNSATGDNNAFFGQSAGFNNSAGSSNIFIGFQSGLSNTVESNNTFIGTSANGAAGITNATAIGSNASVTQSNSLVLGSINTVNGATSNTNVGIGTTAPSSVFHIVSQAEQLITASTNWTGGAWVNLANTDTGGRTWNVISTASANSEGAGKLLVRDATGGGAVRMTFNTNGNVGIGTTGPNAKLHVAGGDVAITTQSNGVILRATDGSNCYRVTVNNAGFLSTAAVTCP